MTDLSWRDAIIRILGEADEPLVLRGTVKRLATPAGPGTPSTAAMLFDPTLSDQTRTRLTGLINHWASGPSSMEPRMPPELRSAMPTLDQESAVFVLAAY